MESPSNRLEQKAFKTRHKIKDNMLIVTDKSTHEEHLPEPLQTNNKQFKIVITFLTGYNGIYNVADKNIKFYFKKSISDEAGFNQITTPQGSYELESLNKELKRFVLMKNIIQKLIIP